MAGVGHQCGGIGDVAVGEFNGDKYSIERNGDRKRVGVVGRHAVMMMSAVAVRMPVIVVCVGMRFVRMLMIVMAIGVGH